MYLGRVIGTCVATDRAAGLEGVKLLVVEPVNTALARTGAPLVAADTVGVGVGEVVFLVGAREAALALDPSFVPVDAAIVGIVDEATRADGAKEFLRGRDDGGAA